MDLSSNNLLIMGSILLFVSVISSKTSLKIGVPTLILFIAIGILAGSEGIGGIHFENPKAAQFLGIIALNLILFSGGLETHWKNIKPVWVRGLTFSTLGVMLTATCVGLFCYYVLGCFGILESLLLGAIISSTDAASTFAVFRSHKTGLKRNLRSILEFESGSNDPMAYFLTVTLISMILNPGETWYAIVPRFILGMTIGAFLGVAVGMLAVKLINKISLEIDGLYPVLVLSIIFILYSVTELVKGNGFLAVYIMGLILGNNTFAHKHSLIQFYNGTSWMMQIVMFLTLGLLVYPSEIPSVMLLGIAISIFLMFFARPLTVLICTMFSHMQWRDRVFISWGGLRGASPIIFATYPMVAGIDSAKTIFNIVFFISFLSMLLQGSTLLKLAEYLHLLVPERLKKRYYVHLADSYHSELSEIEIRGDSSAIGKQIMELDIPESILVVLINRGGRYFGPKGSTVIEAYDRLYVIAEHQSQVDELSRKLESTKHFDLDLYEDTGNLNI